MLQYSKSRKHVGPLWFSTISTNIMWWTYVKAFWRAIMTAMGFQRIQFKTTLKVLTFAFHQKRSFDICSAVGVLCAAVWTVQTATTQMTCKFSGS